MGFDPGPNIYWANYLFFPSLYSGHNNSYLTELTELDSCCLQSTQHKALCKASPETTWKLSCICSLPSLPGNWSHHEQEVNGLGGGSPCPARPPPPPLHFNTSRSSLICLPNTLWLERLELSPPLLCRLPYSKVLPVPKTDETDAWISIHPAFIKHQIHQVPAKHLHSYESTVVLEPE